MTLFIKSKTGFISNYDWQSTIDSQPNLIVPSHVFYKVDDVKVYDTAFIVAGKEKDLAFARLCQWGAEDEPIKVEIVKKDELEGYLKLQAIAKALGAELYCNKKEIFDPEKHLPKPKAKINRKTAWQDKSFGEGTRWMALTIKDAKSFVETLSMKKVSHVSWSDGLAQSDNSRSCMITHSIEGFVFVTGIDLPHFVNALTTNLPAEDLSLEVLTNQLAQLSKQYGEATYYEHYDRSMQLNGYFKAKDGKFIYGHWYADGQYFEQGKIPKELKKLIDPESPMTPTAMEVSEIWAISPEDLVYFEVLKGAEVWVLEF
ncbi:MAG: hypothetical protein ABIV51_07795 [Saprospiraceae bacterium]